MCACIHVKMRWAAHESNSNELISNLKWKCLTFIGKPHIQRYFPSFFDFLFEFRFAANYLSNQSKWNHVESYACTQHSTHEKGAMLELRLLKNVEWHKQIPTVYM